MELVTRMKHIGLIVVGKGTSTEGEGGLFSLLGLVTSRDSLAMANFVPQY